ncbi:phosphoglycolate phosphatase-like HAD superfamily hydrolase [Streptomyces sp. Amel2xB2]|uniref:HAD family hydrolase n=1 Tax=Streptomyces sp. Amel2xB2 TaxID=1305829 RepID=UPI000DBA9DEF|nr:HAD family hydrolase [Streptomyces sp. Amel2xB2]RAJ58823.1 phosphoglycolate phosphatase-like HAD superfamily hydrolase [Streptomyces sp. Amel2xB2]
MNRPASRSILRTGLAIGAVLASIPLATAAGATEHPAGPSAKSHEAADGARAADRHGCAVVWFDLGETLVHTAEDESTAYVPGAAAYLRELRERDIEVGLITNVPPSWGDTDAKRAAALKKEVDKTWKGSTPFAWKDFGDRILTPRTEAESKPAPALWERAKKNADGCRLVYQAETAEETDAAAKLGYAAYQVGQPDRPAFLPARVIEHLADGS